MTPLKEKFLLRQLHLLGIPSFGCLPRPTISSSYSTAWTCLSVFLKFFQEGYVLIPPVTFYFTFRISSKSPLSSTNWQQLMWWVQVHCNKFQFTKPTCMKWHCRAGTINGPGICPWPTCYLWWASLFWCHFSVICTCSSPARTMKSWCCSSFALKERCLHGLRNLWQILFHIGVGFLFVIDTDEAASGQAVDCGVWGWRAKGDGLTLIFFLRGSSQAFPFYFLASPQVSILEVPFNQSRLILRTKIFFTGAVGSMKLLDTWSQFCVRVAAESPVQHLTAESGSPVRKRITGRPTWNDFGLLRWVMQ